MSRFLVHQTAPITYLDRRQLLRSLQTEEDFRASQQALQDQSCTLYVGNLSYFTREAQVFAHFSPYGHIREVLMGLREQEATTTTSSSSSSVSVISPCGFCFVIFERRAAAIAAWQGLHLSLLDDRVIHVSWDVGLTASSRFFLPPPPLSSSSSASPSKEGEKKGVTSCPTPVMAYTTVTSLVEAVLSRRWGRGANGAQVVDNIRQTHDEGRGGLGELRKIAAFRRDGGIGSGSEKEGLPRDGEAGRQWTDVDAVRSLWARAVRTEHHREGGGEGGEGSSMPQKMGSSRAPSFFNMAAFHARCNQWNGLEGEGEDLCYYWIKGGQGRQIRKQPRRPPPNAQDWPQRGHKREGYGVTEEEPLTRPRRRME